MALNNACRNLPTEQKSIEPEMLKVLAETEGQSLCAIFEMTQLTTISSSA